MRYRVKGQITVDVEIVIEADGECEAREAFDGLDLFVDEQITCTELNIENYDINEVLNLSAENWDNMGKVDRANRLVDNGIPQDEAYDMAENDSDSVPEEWLSWFTE